MSRYDKALSVFSPDGRIFQVEYAQAATEKGSPVVFFSDAKTIGVAIEKRAETKHRILDDQDKFKEIEKNIYLSFAGMWPDSIVLIDQALLIARKYAYNTGRRIDILKLVLELSDFVQKYTITGGSRPFGVKLVMFGFTRDKVPVISLIEPDGNYSMYRAGAVGHKSKETFEALEELQPDTPPLVAVSHTLYRMAQKDSRKMTVYEISPDTVSLLSASKVSEILQGVEKPGKREDRA